MNGEYNYLSVFDVMKSVKMFGVWYCLWAYGVGFHSLWTIYVATRIIKFDKRIGNFV
jgi:hypothetical protein